MKSWATTFRLSEGGRSQIVRVVLAVVLVGTLVWALPVRRAGQDGGHHGKHAPELDAFERAGVTELRARRATARARSLRESPRPHLPGAPRRRPESLAGLARHGPARHVSRASWRSRH